jgi:hypothetical protein
MSQQTNEDPSPPTAPEQIITPADVRPTLHMAAPFFLYLRPGNPDLKRPTRSQRTRNSLREKVQHSVSLNLL